MCLNDHTKLLHSGPDKNILRVLIQLYFIVQCTTMAQPQTTGRSEWFAFTLKREFLETFDVKECKALNIFLSVFSSKSRGHFIGFLTFPSVFTDHRPLFPSLVRVRVRARIRLKLLFNVMGFGIVGVNRSIGSA